jgi:NADH:ubiquinone oxidoreductase subunit F (NADH-binding)
MSLVVPTAGVLPSPAVAGTDKRSELLAIIQEHGGLTPGVARQAAEATGVPEAHVYGTASFFHLLADPSTKVRVCMGLSCQMDGARELLAEAERLGFPVAGASCLAACDRPPAVLKDRATLVEVEKDDLTATGGDWTKLEPVAEPTDEWMGIVGPEGVPDDQLAVNLLAAPDYSGAAFAAAAKMDAEAVVETIAESGLQGRGGAGFPAGIKWRGVRAQKETTRYVVLNADEGEPGTFKDREVMLRRPDLVIEGLAIAAHTVGAQDVYLYLRGEFGAPWRHLEQAIASFGDRLGGVRFHLHAGHGAYICGEETALLEALEGKRGMPRLKPPFPTENGLWGKPTLIHNVETIACVPKIIREGAAWFAGLGRTGAGTKLYCVSGHVVRPGVYELPLGVSLDELVSAAGGYVGTPYAFSPGGASSGFLPASERGRALDFKALAEAGSMLGSAGVVVLNDTVDLAWAVRQQLRFFEIESCGQCAPCRIGTRFLRENVEAFLRGESDADAAALTHAAEAAWEMNEGSICGLGQAAALPLTTTMKYFQDVFSHE